MIRSNAFGQCFSLRTPDVGFIEFRLFWDGQFNRSDLTEKFDISVPQASMDLARYQTIAPNSIRYDGSLKTYVATETFTPVVSTPTARFYLSQLRSLADEVLKQKKLGWAGSRHLKLFRLCGVI
jgi:hypothetical protein